jgi:hypothetical protein
LRTLDAYYLGDHVYDLESVRLQLAEQLRQRDRGLFWKSGIRMMALPAFCSLPLTQLMSSSGMAPRVNMHFIDADYARW